MNQSIARCAVRVSVVRDEKQSPETQRDDMARWCQRNGFTPVFYVDAEGYRSGRTADRPDFQRLLNDVEHKLTHAIIFWDVSRLARNNELAQWFYNICKDKKIRLVFVRNGLDFHFDRDDPFVLATSKLLFDVLAGTAEYYSNELSARIRANLSRMRHVENKHIGKIPFGCDRIKGVLVPTKSGCWWKEGMTEWIAAEGDQSTTAPERGGAWQWRGYHDALRRAYELYATGKYGFGPVATMLTMEGYAYCSYNNTPRMFHGHDVNRLLSMHDQYAGHLTSGATTKPWMDSEIVERDVWEPILPVELIEQAVAVRKSRAGQRPAIRSPDRVYELSGMLYCSSCERELRAATIRKKRHYGKKEYTYHRYVHRSKYKVCDTDTYGSGAQTVEERVMEYVIQHFDFEEYREEVARRDPDVLLRQNGDAAQSQIRVLEDSLAKLKDEYFTPGTVLSRDEFRERVLSIETEVERLRSEQLPESYPLVLPDRLTDVLRLAEPEERREYYRLILESIYYDADTDTVVRVVPQEWALPHYFPDG